MEDTPFWLILADMTRHTMLLVDGNTNEIIAELSYPPSYQPQSFVPAGADTVYIPAAAGSAAGCVLKLTLTAPALSVLPAALPAAPAAAAWDERDQVLYIAGDRHDLYALDSGGAVRTVKGPVSGDFTGLIAHAGIIYAATAHHSGGALLALDGAGRTAAVWDTAGTPTNLHLTPDKRALAMPFTASPFTGEGLALFPLATDGLPQAPAVINIQCSSMLGLHAYPCHVAFGPDSRLAYVVNEDCATISVVDLAARTAIGCIPVGRSISELHLRPDGRLAFATSHLFADITVIDLVNGRPLAASAMPQELYGRMCLVAPPPGAAK